VTSGEIDYEQLLAQYVEAKSNLDNLLQKYKVKSLEEAEDLNKTFEAELANTERARRNLEEELGS